MPDSIWSSIVQSTSYAFDSLCAPRGERSVCHDDQSNQIRPELTSTTRTYPIQTSHYNLYAPGGACRDLAHYSISIEISVFRRSYGYEVGQPGAGISKNRTLANLNCSSPVTVSQPVHDDTRYIHPQQRSQDPKSRLWRCRRIDFGRNGGSLSRGFQSMNPFTIHFRFRC